MRTHKIGLQKLLILAIALVMMMGLMAGCKPTSEKNDTDNGITTLRWITGGAPQANSKAAMEAINKILEERYKLNLVFDIYDFGTFDEKMNTIISSGEKYDLCFTTQSWVNKYEPNVKRGAFLALDKLIDEQAPKLKTALPEFLFEQARFKGSVYAIPNYQICYESYGFQLRKDLVEKYHFDYEKVKTYQDMFPFWDAVLENEKGLYPVIAPEGDFIAFLSRQNFMTVSGNALVKKGDSGYKVDWFPEEIKEFRKAFAELYKRKYIREDIITVQDQTADVSGGKYASFLSTIKPGGLVDRKAQTGGHEYVAVSIEKPFLTPTGARATMTAISSGSKNPEAAMRMIEIINTDTEIYNMLNFGIEGVNYTLENGFVKEVPDSGYYYNNAWAIGNQFNALLMVGQEKGIWEETMAINNSAEVSPISGFVFDDSKVTTEVAQLSAIGSEFDMMGLYDDFDQRYDQYVKKMKQAGIENYCKEVQRQLDEWLAETGKK